LLLLTIALDRFRMLRQVLAEVIGMSLSPLLLTVVGDLPILRIIRNFLL